MDFSKMTLKEKVLQTFIVTMREVNKHGGPQKFFEKYPVGGMYYNESQHPDKETRIETGTSSCLKHLEECKKASKIPLLICADEAKIPGECVPVHEGSCGSTRVPQDAFDFGKIRGMQMAANGIDWILQPMADMNYTRNIMGGVTNDPKLNAMVFSKIVEGIQSMGICATVKHFPGLGTSNINMHFAPGRNCLDFDEWMDTYGYYYKETFKAGVCCVMTTHVTLPSYASEGENGFYPIATYSHKLTTELLKGKLGFEGAVVTDALVMGGMATGDLISEVVQAFRAGADLLLWPPVEAADKIVELLESGDIPMERLEDALARISKMRAFREEALKKVFPEPSAAFADETALRINSNAICCIRNDYGLLPLSKDIKKILIVDATDEGAGASTEMLTKELSGRGFEADQKRIIYDTESSVCWQDDIDELQSQYDFVIFNVHVGLFSNWGTASNLIWASHLFDKKNKLIINWGSQYATIDFFPEDPTIIEPRGRILETTVKALVDKILGLDEFRGHPTIV